MVRLRPGRRGLALTAVVCAFLALWLPACGADDTQQYEKRIEGILEPVTALNSEIGVSINALAQVEGGGAVETGGVEALINLRNASVALEMEARQAAGLLADMDVPSQCRAFHDLVASAMGEFEQMGAEYAQGADIFADDRGSELIDIPALERGDAHLLAAQEKLAEAAGAPGEECAG